MSFQPDTQVPPRLPEQGQGPLPLFDLHLRVLSNSYLDFFLERKRIEESYCESLAKLYQKAQQLDAYYDERLHPTTLRSAWSEIRENVDREALARRAFLNNLVREVLNPLIGLKETQDRIRKRIKEDMKESALAYNDYAENDLPKLKRTYIKKCQDVEDYKAAAAAASVAQAQALRSDQNVPLSTSRTYSAAPSRPVVTSPQPLRPLDRRPSGSAHNPRSRSPTSTSNTLSDIAQQGKKQLNHLITFLDKGGVKEGLVGRSENSALRLVRAKREADEADILYRKSVHWLETLRIRRAKILQAGCYSLETFVREYSETVKQVLEKYTDTLTATFSTSAQFFSHGRQQVDKISSHKDMRNVPALIYQTLASAIPKPVLYHNFFVRECKDLIFGFSLLDYATARNLPDGEIPKIVRLCIEEIDKRGLESEGIYRVSGRLASVVDLMRMIERDEQAFSFNPMTDDVYAISTLLKTYLRDLPEPLFRFPLQERIQHSDDLREHIANDFQLLRSKIRRLPAIHRNTLKAVTLHLNRVASNREKNKMDVKNLAIVFGIFGSEEELPKGGDLLSMQAVNDTLMAVLITHAHTLFDDQQSSPPLPPAPSDEPPPPPLYGSQHTKIAEIAPDDFTPPVPPRPPQSIHPSARVNGGSYSPTKSEFDSSYSHPQFLRPGKQEAMLPTRSLKDINSLDFEPLSYHELDDVVSREETTTSASAPTTPILGPETPLSPPLPLLPSSELSTDPHTVDNQHEGKPDVDERLVSEPNERNEVPR